MHAACQDRASSVWTYATQIRAVGCRHVPSPRTPLRADIARLSSCPTQGWHCNETRPLGSAGSVSLKLDRSAFGGGGGDAGDEVGGFEAWRPPAPPQALVAARLSGVPKVKRREAFASGAISGVRISGLGVRQ